MNKIQKVLVVDDSKLARLTLARLLKARKIDVVEADSVFSAIEVLEKELVDAIFLDVQMPERDGFEGLQLFKADSKLKDIPVSMYSGDLSTEAQQTAIQRGAQAYLCKPANNENLDKVLEALEANVVAEDMQAFTDNETPNALFAQQAAALKKHKKALVAFDERTRTLARVFNSEKKTNSAMFAQLLKRAEQLEAQMGSLAKRNEYAEHDDLLHKRAENDIGGQLKKTRDNQRLVLTASIAAIIISLVALVLDMINYFNGL